MTQEHPITPPPELVTQWFLGAKAMPVDQWVTDVATHAARWGADQELEACVQLTRSYDAALGLRADRRPKPPSLKEQALLQLDTLNADLAMHGMGCDLSQIRRALESLPS
jgi:hypothetical protein